jgi:hypothetical protein
MRMLLMISNNNMSLRELYTIVLDNHTAGWITSFMSGLPEGVESLVVGYDAIIYELGPADREDRVAVVQRLLRTGKPVITHVEGRQAAQRGAALRESGAYVVANPVTDARIAETLDALVKAVRGPSAVRRPGIGARMRRLLRGS